MIEPTFNPETNTLTIPRVAGVTHYVDGKPAKGTFVIVDDVVVTAKPNRGSHFRENTVTEWHYRYNGGTEEASDDEESVESELEN